MRTFIARLSIVFIAALAIVAGMSALQRWSPTATFFSKGGDVHAESGGAATTADRAPATAAGGAPIDVANIGDQSVHPEEDKVDFERWPDLASTERLIHALTIMLPVVGAVIAIDVTQRRRRSAKRFAAFKAPSAEAP